LLPLFKAGAGGLNELIAEAERLGIVMSDDDVKAAEAFTDAMNRVKRSIGGLVVRVGSGLSSALTRVNDLFAGQISVVSDWINQNRGMVKLVAMAGGGLIALGGALVVVGGAVKLMAVPFGLLASAIGVVVSVGGLLLTKLGLLSVAVGGLGYLFVREAGIGKKELTGLKDTATSTFKGIAASLTKGDIASAWAILNTGLSSVWMQTIAILKNGWREFRDYILDGIEVIAVKGSSFSQGLVEGLVGTFVVDRKTGEAPKLFDESKREALERQLLDDINAREKERKRLIDEQNKAIAEQQKKLRELVDGTVSGGGGADSGLGGNYLGFSMGIKAAIDQSIAQIKAGAGSVTNVSAGATLSSKAKLLGSSGPQAQMPQILKEQKALQQKMEKLLKDIEKNTGQDGAKLAFS
jgi:hypothetical protein